MTDSAPGLLPNQAHARRTDGDTSHHAAATVHLNGKHEAVLRVFRGMRKQGVDGISHTDLVHWYAYAQERHPGKYPEQTEQSIRSRCAELVAAGQIVDTGRRVPSPTGRTAKVWALAPDAG